MLRTLSRYDADNRLATETDVFGLTLTYGYDANGNVISVKDSLGGTRTSIYDADNRLTSRRFTDGTNQLRIDFTYDAVGNVLTATRYADLAGTQLAGTTTDSYAADNRPTEIRDQNAVGTLLEDFTYSYDAGSRVLTADDLASTNSYAYDAANELIKVNNVGYSYDANQNRTISGYVTGANNQLTTDGIWNYSYDKQGNLIQKTAIASGETWTYTYNHANQETAAVDKTAGGMLLSQSSYTFDVFGNRIAQSIYTQSSGVTTVTQFAYDNAQGVVPNIWADLSASGSLTTRRIFGDRLDQPLARIDSTGTIAWYLTDHLGSIMALMNNQGQLIDQVSFDAFGNIQSESNPPAGDRYKYAGMQFDCVLGEYYTPGREDNATTGRWNQQDPIGVSGANPNLYPYVGNGSPNATDPMGLDKLDDLLKFNPSKAAQDVYHPYYTETEKNAYLKVTAEIVGGKLIITAYAYLTGYPSYPLKRLIQGDKTDTDSLQVAVRWTDKRGTDVGHDTNALAQAAGNTIGANWKITGEKPTGAQRAARDMTKTYEQGVWDTPVPSKACRMNAVAVYTDVINGEKNLPLVVASFSASLFVPVDAGKKETWLMFVNKEDVLPRLSLRRPAEPSDAQIRDMTAKTQKTLMDKTGYELVPRAFGRINTGYDIKHP